MTTIRSFGVARREILEEAPHARDDVDVALAARVRVEHVLVSLRRTSSRATACR